MANRDDGRDQGRSGTLALIVGSIGVAAMGVTNKLRKRPLLFQPWLHVTAAIVGSYAGSKLGTLYEDVAVIAEKQIDSRRILPSWAYGRLSADELEQQLKRQRLEELHQKYSALSHVEEKEFKASFTPQTVQPNKYFQ